MGEKTTIPTLSVPLNVFIWPLFSSFDGNQLSLLTIQNHIKPGPVVIGFIAAEFVVDFLSGTTSHHSVLPVDLINS